MEADALHDLTAAYALDALDAEDARSYEAHLARCERCQEELASLSESLAFGSPGATRPTEPVPSWAWSLPFSFSVPLLT